jgi:hypothetical protein
MTLKEIIMQKTEQWHQNNPVHLVKQGLLVSKSQPNNFDKSPVFKILMESVNEWLEQKNGKPKYLTLKEMEMPKDMIDMQIVLGLQSCKTKQDVIELLEDVRQHERLTLIKELSL